MDGTLNLTSGGAFYEVVPKEHWSVPGWINEDRFMSSLEYLGAIGVGKGWMISYSQALDHLGYINSYVKY